MVADLVTALSDYPHEYRQCVFSELAISFKSEAFDVREILSRQAGFELPKATREETKAQRQFKPDPVAMRRTQDRPRAKAADKSTMLKGAAVIAAILFFWFLIR